MNESCDVSDLLLTLKDGKFHFGIMNNKGTRVKVINDDSIYNVKSDFYSKKGEDGYAIVFDASNGIDNLTFLPIAVAKGSVSNGQLALVDWKYLSTETRSLNGVTQYVRNDNSYYILAKSIGQYFSQYSQVSIILEEMLDYDVKFEENEGGWDNIYQLEGESYTVSNQISKRFILEKERELNYRAGIKTDDSYYVNEYKEF